MRDTQSGFTSAPKESFFSEVLKFALIALFIVLPIRFFVAQPFIVSGSSMDPTFMNGQYIIVDELSYKLGKPERGDVVIFSYPQDKSKYFIKRIIGLPEETVSIQGSAVSIKNTEHPEGFTLNESYIDRKSENDLSLTLKDGEYFVMGDNRPASYDSRFWGPLPEDLIIGRPLVRLLPFSSLSFLPGSLPAEPSAD
jgi:signal peptidase I